MRWYRQFQPSAPEEFYVFLGLQTVPPVEPFPSEHQGKKTCGSTICYNGPIADGEKAVNAIRSVPCRKPIIDWAQPMPYSVIQTLFDALLPKGLQWYWKGDFVKETAGRRHRCACGRCRKASKRALRNAPLSGRRRRSIGKRKKRPRAGIATRPGRS